MIIEYKLCYPQIAILIEFFIYLIIFFHYLLERTPENDPYGDGLTKLVAYDPKEIKKKKKVFLSGKVIHGDEGPTDFGNIPAKQVIV